MRLTLERRPSASRAMELAAPLLAVAATLVTGAVLFASLGRPPAAALASFFIHPIADRYGLGELAIKAAPLLLCATGLAIGFHAKVWNIGAEGQLTLGAIAGGGVALLFWGSGAAGWWLVPLILLAGACGGMLWALIPAVLRTRFHANEILVSLMLVYVAQLLLAHLIHGPWKDPDGMGFPESRIFEDSARLAVLVEGTRVHLGVLLALLAAGIGWLFLERSRAGFIMRVSGEAEAAAAYAGFDRTTVVTRAFLIGGGLAGLAGAIEVAGPIGQVQPSVSPGYGFAAIIVAFLGRLHPWGIVAASVLMALMYLGGEYLQMEQNLPLAITGVFQGLLLFYLLAADVLVRWRLRLVGRA